MHLDTKELPFGERVDVEISVAAEGNAIEPAAWARSFEVRVLQPYFQLVTAGLEPQELGRARICDKHRSILANGHVVAKMACARKRGADLSFSRAQIEAFKVASAYRTRSRYPKRRHIIRTDPQH